jgi:hypothetical protein
VNRFAVAAVLLMLAACGGRETVDDQGLHRDVLNDINGAEVTFNGTVLDGPVQSGGHQRFHVKATTREVLEIDHNTALAPYVPIHIGDHLVIHGELYIDPGPRLGVHCTHAETSSGCPYPGWILFDNTYYE